MTKNSIIKELDNNKKILRNNKVKRIGLFGSYARGDYRKDSDIDFLIEFELNEFGENFKGLYEAFTNVYDFLKNKFQKNIELITADSLSPYIKPYIEKEVQWYETKYSIS